MKKPLKIYGSITNNSNGYKVAFKKKKTRFLYKDYENDENKTKEMAQNFCIEQTLLHYPKINTFEIINDKVNVYLENEKFFVIDLEDLEKISGYYWHIRNNSIVAKVKSVKVTLKKYLLDTNLKVLFRDKNELNLTRDNIYIDPSIKKEEFDNIDESILTIFNDFNQFIKEDGIIYIEEVIWNKMKEYANKNKQTIEIISNKLSEYLFNSFPYGFDLPLPNDNEIKFDLIKLDKKQLIPKNLENYKNVLSSSKFGQPLCNRFMLPSMLECKHRYNPYNFIQVWENDKLRNRLCKTLFHIKIKELNNSNLLKAYSWKFYRAYNFPPSVVKYIYDNSIKNNDSITILDPCSGYGGRFVGFWFSKKATKYIGIDPNSNLIEPYKYLSEKLIEMFPNENKSFEFIHSEAQEIDYFEKFGKTIDLVFTSPPYFNTEIYSDESTQSCNKFKTYQEWKQEFFFETLKRIYKSLKQNGKIIINIKGEEYGKDLIEFVINELNMKQEEMMFLQLKAFNRNKSKGQLNMEPIYCFIKINDD